MDRMLKEGQVFKANCHLTQSQEYPRKRAGCVANAA